MTWQARAACRDADPALFAAWNAANRRAREEYRHMRQQQETRNRYIPGCLCDECRARRDYWQARWHNRERAS